MKSGQRKRSKVAQKCWKTNDLLLNCDAMMHVLKDSIKLKYSELLTKPISKCNLI